MDGKRNEERHALFSFPGLNTKPGNRRLLHAGFARPDKEPGACTDGSNSPMVRLNHVQMLGWFRWEKQVI